MESEEKESFITTERINHLINFGISEEEAKVYLSLLKRGTRGEIVGRIKKELDIGRTTIYAILERLTAKGWVSSEEISSNPKRIKYVANPPLEILNEYIQKREIQLKFARKSSLFIGDKLDLAYQGFKKLNIHTVHPGAYRYLKTLADQGFKIKTEVIEHIEGSDRRFTYDYELKGPKGLPKDCGLIILEYYKDIENEKHLIQESLEIFMSKTEYELRREKIPGFQDVKLEKTTFDKYLGAKIFIKLKLKKKWWNVGNQVVIPIKNRIFMLFGNESNFQILMDTIVNSEKFHHLV